MAKEEEFLSGKNRIQIPVTVTIEGNFSYFYYLTLKLKVDFKRLFFLLSLKYQKKATFLLEFR
ncbi:hypothetical protein [Bacillus sp. FJAT-27245]|uniref:hypothetical protein n=1 Tax=Bacillus sp. FJAT-27245 TaxID=1684144 RepID=UPI0006A76ECB|nr:hypothetical protein [Bacillus sp. FJAT-27245]